MCRFLGVFTYDWTCELEFEKLELSMGTKEETGPARQW
jgi:hypothetical protein